MEPVLDSILWPTMLDLATCLCQEIERSGLPEPCFCGIIPGELVPLDYCAPCGNSGGQCGMAWVRLVSVQPNIDFDIVGTAANGRGCIEQISATIEVGIARCAPMPDSRGTPPNMSAQLAAAELQFADMAAARRAAVCCPIEDKNLVRSIALWTPFGPDGGCMGGIWQITVSQ